MSAQGPETNERAGMQAGGTPKDRPKTVPSDEVGRGAGQDPESAAAEDEGSGGEEAFEDRPTRPMNDFEDRPTRPMKDKEEGEEPAATQRPPSDS